jgi:hypothetical protein
MTTITLKLPPHIPAMPFPAAATHIAPAKQSAAAIRERQEAFVLAARARFGHKKPSNRREAEMKQRI